MSMACMKWILEHLPLGAQERYFFLSDFSGNNTSLKCCFSLFVGVFWEEHNV